MIRSESLVVDSLKLWQRYRMEITVTKTIEEFIKLQIAKGYSDVNEVTRQAFLRWMDEEEYFPDPPNLREKLDAARQGQFKLHNPREFESLIKLAHEPSH